MSQTTEQAVGHGSANKTSDDKTRLLPGSKVLVGISLIVGVAGIVASVITSRNTDLGMQRFYFAYLFGLGLFTAISCASVIFTLIQHLVRAGWVTNVRRIMETLAAQIGLIAVLFIPVIFVTLQQGSDTTVLYSGVKPADTKVVSHHHPKSKEMLHEAQTSEKSEEKAVAITTTTNPSDESAVTTGSTGDTYASLYPYKSDEGNEQVLPGVQRKYDEVIHGKSHWLTPGFWSFRVAAYLVILSAVAWYYRKESIKQDETGDVEISTKLGKLTPPLVLVSALCVTFLAFDVFMALDPHWFSTMFGVYFFASGTQAMWATMILILFALQSRGYLKQSVSVEIQHDLGKFLFAFVVFWTYIAYSQYMLQWYANLPEETFWFDKRGYSTAHPNGYSMLVIILLVGRFILPFVGLISRHVKRNKIGLGFWAVWLLCMGVLDMYLLVMPELSYKPLFGIPEIGALVGVGGIWLANLVRMLAGAELRPVGDPRTHESLAFQNI